jgi:hypothetical protein
MLIDNIMPSYDFTEVHSVRIRASSETAYRAILEVTPAEISGIVRLLFFLRELPEKMAGRKCFEMNSRRPLLAAGFTKLVEQKPREMVLGLIVPGNIGRIWQKSSRLDDLAADDREFLAFNHPDYLKVVMNMLVEDTSEPGVVVVRTESRTRALSPEARKHFTPYWRVIRPFSGLIRRLWLKGIKRRAERERHGGLYAD